MKSILIAMLLSIAVWTSGFFPKATNPLCDHNNDIVEVTHDHCEQKRTYEYKNICWRCHSNISSSKNKQCSKCGWYICNYCGACESSCPRCPAWNNNSSSKKTDYSWVWMLIGGGAVIAGIFWYKKRQR